MVVLVEMVVVDIGRVALTRSGDSACRGCCASFADIVVGSCTAFQHDLCNWASCYCAAVIVLFGKVVVEASFPHEMKSWSRGGRIPITNHHSNRSRHLDFGWRVQGFAWINISLTTPREFWR